MTTLTVVTDDRRIIVDGKVLTFDFEIAPDIRAIQWNGAAGHTEYRDGRMPEPINDESVILPWIALHEDEAARMDAEIESMANAPEPTEDELVAARIAAIDAQLAQIDAESVRPLRAMLAGDATDEDRARLTALEAEAVSLRTERVHVRSGRLRPNLYSF